MAKQNIVTPHAAVLVWNYVDRIGNEGVQKLDETEKVIISTLSCISIETNKAKSQPNGSFQLVLAPFKNWVSTLTAGSWCCLMMSNEPINEKDLKKANKKHVKMIGKIESVRVATEMQSDGSRRTLYYVSGVDWGHIFNNTVYVDNLIASPNDPVNQGNTVAVALRNTLFGKDGTPKSFAVKDNLRSIVNIFGQSLTGLTKAGTDINRLATAIYNFRMPRAMVEYFDFKGPDGKISKDMRLNKVLNLTTGSLKTYNSYTDTREAQGFINPFSLQGSHSFWQILLENSNPALNEMFCDMQWDQRDGNNEMALTLFNRIKPFSYKDFSPKAGNVKGPKSFFQNVKINKIDNTRVLSVNAGTNWRDKYNFIEVKPQFQDFIIIANWYKQKSQNFDAKAFEREGFRPMIVDTKQFPTEGNRSNDASSVAVDWNQLEGWTKLLREWYFDTHRMLNGTITIQGTDDYIGVGENIKFDAGLINATPNMNKATVEKGKNLEVLAHVESVNHKFTVAGDGARTYMTTIQFVRGIIVDGDNVRVGEGTLDKDAELVSPGEDRNRANVVSTSTDEDPDPQKVRGS